MAEETLFNKEENFSESPDVISESSKFSAVEKATQQNLSSEVLKFATDEKFSSEIKFSQTPQYTVVSNNESIDGYDPLSPPSDFFLLNSGGGLLLQSNGYKIIL